MEQTIVIIETRVGSKPSPTLKTEMFKFQSVNMNHVRPLFARFSIYRVTNFTCDFLGIISMIKPLVGLEIFSTGVNNFANVARKIGSKSVIYQDFTYRK